MELNDTVKKFRAERATDLRRVTDVLSRKLSNGYSQDALSKAISALKDYTYLPTDKKGVRDPHWWGYEIEDFRMEVDIPKPKHLRPKNIQISKVEVTLNMKLLGDVRCWNTMKDPLKELNMNIVVRAVCDDQVYFTGLHVDRHVEGEENTEPHPVYHVQYSVNPHDDQEFDYGQVLSMDTPRVMHYPMDFLLGLNFVTSNFFPLAWEALLEDGEYTGLLASYQKAMWKPYSHSLASKWKPYNDGEILWEPQLLCPMLF